MAYDFTGVYQEEGSSLWSYRLSVLLPNGKKKDTKRKNKYKTRTEAATARAAHRQQILKDYEDGYGEKKRIRFKDLWIKFIDSYSVDYTYSSVVRYQSLYNNWLKTFDNYYVDSIRTEDLKKFLYDLKKKDKAYSYIEGFYKCLNGFFKFAIDNKYLKNNPLLPSCMPSESAAEGFVRKKRGIISVDDFNSILKSLETSRNRFPFLLGYYCALRLGEAYSVRLSDIDIDNLTITINKQLQYQEDEWCFVPPKYGSYRVINFPPVLLPYIEELVKDIEDSKIKYPKSYHFTNRIHNKLSVKESDYYYEDVDDFLAVQVKGQMLSPNSGRDIPVIMRRHGLVIEGFSFHVLRHTCCTRLADSNCPVSVLTQFMGHKKISTTWEYYTHVSEQGLEYLKQIQREWD